MRRRANAGQSNVPARLRRYDPADWGADDQAPTRFYAALADWREEHPDDELDFEGPCPDVPFNPYTDLW